MVPQDGFLFDATVAENVRFARPELTDDELAAAFTELGLADWVDGAAGRAGHPGRASAARRCRVGERQLVALVRAYVADPDLLVLDEATSAVDPATEVRLQRALDAVTRGRTTVAIAHRLSTAQAADEVIVVDRGRIVQRGPHDELVADRDSVYARLYASWLEQTRWRLVDRDRRASSRGSAGNRRTAGRLHDVPGAAGARRGSGVAGCGAAAARGGQRQSAGSGAGEVALDGRADRGDQGLRGGGGDRFQPDDVPHHGQPGDLGGDQRAAQRRLGRVDVELRRAPGAAPG